jgi:hypothetical protein
MTRFVLLPSLTLRSIRPRSTMAGLRSAADQLAISHARESKKQTVFEADRGANSAEDNGQILLREWVKLGAEECPPSNHQCIKIFSWNVRSLSYFLTRVI